MRILGTTGTFTLPRAKVRREGTRCDELRDEKVSVALIRPAGVQDDETFGGIRRLEELWYGVPKWNQALPVRVAVLRAYCRETS